MKINVKVIPGHKVASGKAKKSRYPEGTLALQKKHFLKKGLDLGEYFSGTINVDIAPWKIKIIQPKFFFEKVDWSPYISPENFYFFEIYFYFSRRKYNGLIYLPDPKTKEENHQSSSTLELLLPFVPDIQNGSGAELESNEDQLLFVQE